MTDRLTNGEWKSSMLGPDPLTRVSQLDAIIAQFIRQTGKLLTETTVFEFMVWATDEAKKVGSVGG